MNRSTRSLVALATVTASIAVTVATGLLAGPANAAGSTGSRSALPSDSAAHGYIGLCNEAGQNVTGGSIGTRPFVWEAVASTPSPSAYRGHGQNAVLGIFQPRPGTLPAEWGGSPLTAASYYRKATPSAQATYADQSLRSVIKRYPPEVDGLYVLRMYVGRAGYGNYSATYPTTTIQVTGRSWRVVSGGTVNCHAAKAVSNEQLTGVAGHRSTTPRKPSTSERTVDTARSQVILVPAARVRSAAAHGSSGGAAGRKTVDAAQAADSTATSSVSWVVWVLVGMVVALLLALVVVVRTRRKAAPTTA